MSQKYDAIRAQMGSASSLLTMQDILMLAVQPTLAKALDATSAKFIDASFARVASNFTFDISDIEIPDVLTPSMASGLPLNISLVIKAEKSTLDVQDTIDASAVPFWVPGGRQGCGFRAKKYETS